MFFLYNSFNEYTLSYSGYHAYIMIYKLAYFKRHLGLLLAMALGLAGLSTGLVPFASRLWLLGLFFHMQGLAQGFIDTCKSPLRRVHAKEYP